jgi:hypothetical protein
MLIQYNRCATAPLKSGGFKWHFVQRVEYLLHLPKIYYNLLENTLTVVQKQTVDARTLKVDQK